MTRFEYLLSNLLRKLPMYLHPDLKEYGALMYKEGCKQGLKGGLKK